MSQTRGHNSRALAWMLCFMALPVIYVVSTGPMFFVITRYFPGRATDPWVDRFFTPYSWLCDSTPLEKPLVAYGDWWLSKAEIE